MTKIRLVLIALFSLPAFLWADTYVYITTTPTSVTVSLSLVGLPHETDCTTEIRDVADTLVDSITSTQGRANRSVTFVGLTAETYYKVLVNCGAYIDWDSAFFTTPSAAPGAVTVPVGIGPNRINPAATRVTVEFDDNAAFSSSETVQETDCGSGCVVPISVPNDLTFFRIRWQNSSDTTLSIGKPWILGGTQSTHLQISTTYVPPSGGIPEKGTWESQMLSYGATQCALYTGVVATDYLLAREYDGARVLYQIADYTLDDDWLTCANRGNAAYSYYARQNIIPSYQVFTAGLHDDFDLNATATSKTAIITLTNGGYCRDTYPIANLVTAFRMREVAYCVNALLDAEAVGETERARRDLLVTTLKGHLTSTFVTQDYRYPMTGYDVAPTDPLRGLYHVKPFYAALAMHALIKYNTADPDVAVPPLIKATLDWLWTNAWVAADESFWYDNEVADPADPMPAVEGAPDLNLLLAPSFAWYYAQTCLTVCDTTYRDRGDAVFGGGVKGAWLNGTRQFNQNYLYSFDYIALRTANP